MNEFALDVIAIYGAPDVRMSILAMGVPMRPNTLKQTDHNTVKSYLRTGRAIRSFVAVFSSPAMCSMTMLSAGDRGSLT
jgi:hypothetical protein